MTRLNPQQHLKTAELLLAHRPHRPHGAPPGTPEPGGVSPLLCRGVSSLYCAYTRNVAKSTFWKNPTFSGSKRRQCSTAEFKYGRRRTSARGRSPVDLFHATEINQTFRRLLKVLRADI